MLNILIFGPPGAGKGTQASLIAKQFKLKHLSSGDLLRQERENGVLGRQIRKYQDSGHLVPDSLIIKMFEAAVAKELKGAGFIFDGYPRNLRQAKALDKFFKTHGSALHLVINLKLSATEAARRVVLRGKTSGRSDDNRKTVLSRFQVYLVQTKPLLEYYKKQKKILHIDGRPPVPEVFKQIKIAINGLLPKLKKTILNG